MAQDSEVAILSLPREGESQDLCMRCLKTPFWAEGQRVVCRGLCRKSKISKQPSLAWPAHIRQRVAIEECINESLSEPLHQPLFKISPATWGVRNKAETSWKWTIFAFLVILTIKRALVFKKEARVFLSEQRWDCFGRVAVVYYTRRHSNVFPVAMLTTSSTI